MRISHSRSVFVSAAVFALAAGVSALSGAPAAAQPLPPTPAAQGATKIAVANPAHIFNEMAETKALQGQMLEEQKKFQAAQTEKVSAMNELKKRRDDLSPDHPQWAEMNTQLATLTAEYKVWLETQRAIAENTQKMKMRTLFKKIEDAVAEVAKRDGIDIVVSDNRDPLPPNLDEIDVRTFRAMILQRDVLFAGANSDLSQKVLTLLDARYRGVALNPK